MKVKTDYAGCECITPGKEYEAVRYRRSNILCNIVNDDGDTIIIKTDGCAFLKRHPWQIVEE